METVYCIFRMNHSISLSLSLSQPPPLPFGKRSQDPSSPLPLCHINGREHTSAASAFILLQAPASLPHKTASQNGRLISEPPFILYPSAREAGKGVYVSLHRSSPEYLEQKIPYAFFIFSIPCMRVKLKETLSLQNENIFISKEDGNQLRRHWRKGTFSYVILKKKTESIFEQDRLVFLTTRHLPMEFSASSVFDHHKGKEVLCHLRVGTMQCRSVRFYRIQGCSVQHDTAALCCHGNTVCIPCVAVSFVALFAFIFHCWFGCGQSWTNTIVQKAELNGRGHNDMKGHSL